MLREWGHHQRRETEQKPSPPRSVIRERERESERERERYERERLQWRQAGWSEL